MKITPIPAGTRDILPAEAAEIRYLESTIRAVFQSYGYGEVITPALELESALEKAGEKRFRRSFRLFDERGDVMVMRPEMTTPIARLVATRMADREPPFRLCYFANSFRPTTPQRGRQSEFYQAGLELLGGNGPAADAEVLAVLCGSLEACGLDDFSVALGESSFFRALLESLGVGGKASEAIFEALVARDLVRLTAEVVALDLPTEDRQMILDATSLRGGSEVLARAKDMVRSPGMEEALKRLARTYYLVTRHGFSGRILFDLGIFRNFDYYTGIVFEVLSGGLGFPIGGGGRYDALLARFGRPMPAVGFALGLDRLHIAVTEQGRVPVPARGGVMLVGGFDQTLDLARELRAAGITVAVTAAGVDAGEAVRLAAGADLRWAVIPVSEGDSFRLEEVGGEAARSEGKMHGAGAAGAGAAVHAGGADVLSREEIVKRLAG
ncbi:MAG: ATP phosphoribosyltransferase regulatory subunit [Thermoleophilia bacterium]